MRSADFHTDKSGLLKEDPLDALDTLEIVSAPKCLGPADSDHSKPDAGKHAPDTHLIVSLSNRSHQM